MDFVEDHDRFHTGAEKYLRIADHILNHGQITVNVKEARGPEAFRQGGFARQSQAIGDSRQAASMRYCQKGRAIMAVDYCTRAYQM